MLQARGVVIRRLCSVAAEERSSHTIPSSLNERHRTLAKGGIPPVEFEWEKSQNAQRERFGKYGLKSGVPMGVLWPTVEEIVEEKSVGLFREYREALQEVQSTEEVARKQAQKKIEDFNKNLKKYPSLVAKYEASLVTAEKERDEKELALEKRIREIQEYFGYWMDPKDPRFEVMLQQKEAEELKAKKMAKRLEIQKKKFAETV